MTAVRQDKGARRKGGRHYWYYRQPLDWDNSRDPAQNRTRIAGRAQAHRILLQAIVVTTNFGERVAARNLLNRPMRRV